MPTSRNWMRIIGIWQMIGGALSAIAFLDAVPRLVTDADTRTSVLVAVIPLCGLSILAGYALFEGRRAGRRPSMVIQSIQLLGIGVGPRAIRLVLGPYILIGLIPQQWIGFSIGWQPQLHLYFHDVSPGYYLNVLALACLWYLAFKWPAPDEATVGLAESSPDAPAV